MLCVSLHSAVSNTETEDSTRLKPTAKQACLRSRIFVDVDNKLTGVRSVPDIPPDSEMGENICFEKASAEKIYGTSRSWRSQTSTPIPSRKKLFYKLPHQKLMGNALFAHLTKFLYNASSNNGLVLVTCAYRLRSAQSFFRQVGADVPISNSQKTP